MRRKGKAGQPESIDKKMFGGPGGPIYPGDVVLLAEANLFYCSQGGGHLVRKNRCPIHHAPATRYGSDPDE
ncbi:MAG TPA: hypothetical protein VGR02_00920 [Thermoanaerobaculia bacterium]|jgi:hypothetical protein|nr:hypothetical protein [Thermoanaerobaculia bacterium]